ncbi:MAG: superoxide dismutase [Candidatus Sumerlaeia bacterium]|nr:superoxide dismutase [Candidatus Sumerlaeia bacterium]
MTANRRDFLVGSSAILAAAASGLAFAQEATPEAPAGALQGHAKLVTQLVPGAIDDSGKWVLPALRYDYNALEPHIDAQTMEIHHSRHHAAYVNGLIEAEARMADARASGDNALIEYWTRKASFNGGGHFLHCLFWDCMSPEGAGGEPRGQLARQIEKQFGSFQAFRDQFSAAARTVEGSGWGILGYQIAGARLTILQGLNQNLLSQWAIIPLLAIDVWEHAYYLKYQNRRADYVQAWWNVVDWKSVGRRFEMLHH